MISLNITMSCLFCLSCHSLHTLGETFQGCGWGDRDEQAAETERTKIKKSPERGTDCPTAFKAQRRSP